VAEGEQGLRIEQEVFYNVLALRQEFDGFDEPQNIEKLSRPRGRLYTRPIVRKAVPRRQRRSKAHRLRW
jgi:hypothetical protein